MYTGWNVVTINTMSQPDLAAASASNGEKEHLPEGMVCPACGSKLIRRSMRRTFKDRFMSLLGKWPYRCQMCNLRFNGPQDPESLAREQAHHNPDEEVDDELAAEDSDHPPETHPKE
jgi:hypothetical protein